MSWFNTALAVPYWENQHKKLLCHFPTQILGFCKFISLIYQIFILQNLYHEMKYSLSFWNSSLNAYEKHFHIWWMYVNSNIYESKTLTVKFLKFLEVTIFYHSWNIRSSSSPSTSIELLFTASKNFLTVACLPSLFLQAISIWNICVWTLKLWFILICSICALVNPRPTPSSWKSAPMCLLTNNNSLSVGGLSVVWTPAILFTVSLWQYMVYLKKKQKTPSTLYFRFAFKLFSF